MLVTTAAVVLAQQGAGRVGPAPALPYVDTKACPFEGCVYREWTAQKGVAVYSTWRAGRTQVGMVGKRDKVTALGGVVVTNRPGSIRMDRDLPAVGLKRGDTILTYSYLGEGFSQVWVNGRFYEDFDISFTKWPSGAGCNGAHCAATYVDLGEKTWWVEVRLKSGARGWVNMDDAEFDGTDQLA